MKKFNLIIALMIVQAAFFLVTCTKPTGTLTEIPLFEKDVWGEWIRMDNGENWYFAGNYRKVGNSFYASAVNMERQSENVIKVTEGSGV
ncbi:MAG TPA: hypothetical protein DEQ14_05925, partial [Treponema sp.]|nr:hypothetical protein [Treponema sp.]